MIVGGRNMYEDAIKKMDEYIENLKEIRATNPELAKKIAREGLQRAGIITKEGKLAPPYNKEKVYEEDFTRGPRECEYEENER